MKSDAIIIDGYVDEPACLGVPPYISPYIRTAAGVLTAHGFNVRYLTIDRLRVDHTLFPVITQSSLVLVIAGVTVPGKYLGGTPATLTEVQQIGLQARGKLTLIGGPIGFGYAPAGGHRAVKQVIAGFDHLLRGSLPEALDSFLSGGEPRGDLDYCQSDRWAVLGSPVITQHPSYPHIMCELETARGCARGSTGGCSFCTEPLYGEPVYRSVEGVATEVEALYAHGARHFRLGRQPDLLTYGAGSGEFPRPRPDLLASLFLGVREAAPDLRTLHIDNVNPGTIARHEEASREALRVIVMHHTSGDVAAFGMETADPEVIRKNNLKASPEQVLHAIRVVNEEGGKRVEGIPGLLPGLNFIAGLAGETPATFEMNERFLSRVLEAGLLVRRINIRQLMPFEGTRAYTENTLGLHDSRFRVFKEYVRSKIDPKMLEEVFPAGTVLRGVVIEQSGPLSFGRQMGSYPILAGIPVTLTERSVIDAVVVGWGSRSVTALPVPVEVNRLPAGALRWLPGIGKNKVAAIVAKRPFRSLEEFHRVAGATPMDDFLEF